MLACFGPDIFVILHRISADEGFDLKTMRSVVDYSRLAKCRQFANIRLLLLEKRDMLETGRAAEPHVWSG